MRNRTPRIVQGTTWQGRALWVLLLLLMLSLLLHYTDGGSNTAAVIEEATDTTEVVMLRQKLTAIQEQRQALRRRVALLERSGQIDREAAQQLSDELKIERGERLKLKQEMAILKRILSTSVESEGVNIQAFKLEKKDQVGRFHYRFTIRQALKDAGLATGWIYLSVDGASEEEGEVSFSLAELTEGGDEKLKMRFRHFQDLEGDIDLPEGFLPHSVIIDIRPTNKKLPPLKKRFDWLVTG